MPDGTPVRPARQQPPAAADRGAGERGEAHRLDHAAGRARRTPARSRTRAAESASRYVPATEMLIDSTSPLRIEEEIDVAHPRLTFELRKTPKPGYVGLAVAPHPRGARPHHRVRREVRTAAPGLRRPSGRRRLDRPGHRLDGQQGRGTRPLRRRPDRRRRAAERRLLRAAASQPAHPGAEAFPPLALRPSRAAVRGVPAHRRRARDLRDAGAARARPIRPTTTTTSKRSSCRWCATSRISSPRQLGRRAIRLEIIERAPNAFVSTIRDRTLFRNATLVLEVAARRPLTEIQSQFPHLFKVGPNTKMNEIVHAHLPGVNLIHLPTPPPQIRAITDHVYFYLDRTSPLWPEFSHGELARHALLRRLAGTCSLSSGPFWRDGDERRRLAFRSVRAQRADDHPPEPGRAQRVGRRRPPRSRARAAAAAASPRRRRRTTGLPTPAAAGAPRPEPPSAAAPSCCAATS